MSKRAQKRRYAAKQLEWIREIKIRLGCADCGYNEHAVALDFDHRPEENKQKGVAQMVGDYGTAAILEEIAKCDVVCSNCHRVRTERRLNGLDP